MNTSLKNKITDFLKGHNLLISSKTYIIGFSGGYDSMCLAKILKDLSKEHGFKLIAAHLNHNWRAEESKKEEINCKEFCQKNNIEFYSETLSSDLPKTELEARNKRYKFFEQAIKNYNADAIFTGHTKTDNVETILYRIIKGTGIKGLKGIPEKRLLANTPIFRPMLDITREETIDYCNKKNLNPNIDSSNENIHYQRNKIRIELIPELKNYNSNIEGALLRLSDLAKNSKEVIEEHLLPIKESLIKDKEIKTQKFITLKESIKKQIITDYLEENSIDYDYKKIDEITHFIEASSSLKSGNTLSLIKEKWLFASSAKIKIINEIKSNVVKSTIRVHFEENKGKTFHPEFNKTLKISKWDEPKPKKFPHEAESVALADFSKIKEPLFLRSRQEGDRIVPFGMKESVKLKKYLINKGVPEHERDNLLLLTTENEILWVAGVGISEKLRVKDYPTHLIKVY